MTSFCATCSGLQKHYKDLDQDSDVSSSGSVRRVITTLPLLQLSSKSCRACALLLQGIFFHQGRFASIQEDKIRVVAETFHSGRPKNLQDHLSVELRWSEHQDECDESDDHDHEPDEDYPDLKLEFFTDQDDQSAFSAIGRGRHIITNPLRELGMTTVRSMIEHCNENHSLCSNRKPGLLPHRVLDLSAEDPFKGIRLHELDADQAAHQVTHEYVALSYCRGVGRTITQTTTTTLKAYKRSIPWRTLPKVFQEAVLFTKALGIRFLWIDALCIVQDDPYENLCASLQLDSIYGNAFLTIAATSAAEPRNGLFALRTQAFKMQAKDSKELASSVYVREQPSHYSFKVQDNASNEVNVRTPLLKRAWAYAERLLSPRVLHFTDSEMILECQEALQCECGRIDDPMYDSRTTDSVKRDFATFTAVGVANDHERMDSAIPQLAATTLTDDDDDVSTKAVNPLELWSYIVTEYTTRDLSYDADRLLAIAGVARSLSKVTGAGYIAGHWTNSTLGLLWYPSEGTHCRRPKQVTGRNTPSWSWASVEGSPIFFDDASAMDLACLATFPVNGSQFRTFSPISGDIVELRAAMATDVTFHEAATNEYFLSRNGISVEFQPDIIPLRGDDTVKPGETLVCVLVSMSFRSSIIGLVLKEVRSIEATYRRVGRFECYECSKYGSEDDPEDAEALFEHWFPEIDDMTQLDDRTRRTFKVI